MRMGCEDVSTRILPRRTLPPAVRTTKPLPAIVMMPPTTAAKGLRCSSAAVTTHLPCSASRLSARGVCCAARAAQAPITNSETATLVATQPDAHASAGRPGQRREAVGRRVLLIEQVLDADVSAQPWMHPIGRA